MSLPLIAIFGTTGVGKSQLAVELALYLSKVSLGEWRGARVINADSMQTYAGMDIITNKMSLNEQKGVEHRLLGFKRPGEQYVVGQWVVDAMAEIEEAHRLKHVPIVVGGTSYWMQHLIFPNRLSKTVFTEEDTSRPSSRELSPGIVDSLSRLPPELLELFNNLPGQVPSAEEDAEAAFQLYTILTSLDPPMAERWHWKDTRKVLRSLEIIKETGRPPSELVQEQSKEVTQPRYRTLSFWLYSQPGPLNSRLDARVDKMIQGGVLDEIQQLREIATHGKDTGDYTLGIFQSIGYREFHTYLSSESQGPKMFNEAVDNMKSSTRQYAKRQISWIRNKLLPAVYAIGDHQKVMPVYLLDATDVDTAWEKNVRDLAISLTEDFLYQRPLSDPLLLSEAARGMLVTTERPSDPQQVLLARRKKVCAVCTTDQDRPVQIEEGREWERHVKSKSHKFMASKEEREAKKLASIALGIQKRKEREAAREVSLGPTT